MGFAVGQKLISFAATHINLPKLIYAQPRDLKGEVKKGFEGKLCVEKTPHPDRANWNLENVGFAAPCTDINLLHVLGLNGCFDSLPTKTSDSDQNSSGAETRLDNCLKDFLGQLRGHDVWPEKGVFDQQSSTINKELDAWFKLCKANDCTLILLKEKSYDLYSVIKRAADLEYGCYTVCAVGSKLPDREGNSNDANKKGARYQVLSNLALKLNMKMGGDNHWLDIAPLEQAIGGADRTKTTMICGADVTHPSAGSKLGCPSIACVVGSVDNRFMNYPGSMRLQAGRQEVSTHVNFSHTYSESTNKFQHIEDLESMMKERLRDWSAKNDDTLPTDILFYRDGISESQFDKCKN